MTESEVDSFVKKQKIFPSSDENTGDNTDPQQLNDPSAAKPLQPRPPSKEAPSLSMANLTAKLMGRTNMVGGTARQRRKERNSVFSAVNIDRIGEDLLRGCETEGNTSKLRALKQAMRHHVLYQLSFILMLENELNGEKKVCEQRRKESLEESVLHSLLSEDERRVSRGSVSAVELEVEEREKEEEGGRLHSRVSTTAAGPPTTRTAAGGGQFGQNLGKLCGLSSADIKNDENYLASGEIYVNLVSKSPSFSLTYPYCYIPLCCILRIWICI